MKILITNAENRKTFDIINIILRYYTKNELLITSSKHSILLYIIYGKLKRLQTKNFQQFENDLKFIVLSLSHYDKIVYLPIEENATIYFYEFLETNRELKKRFLYLLPPLYSFNLVRNKYLLNLFCVENGIDVPHIITNKEINELQNDFKPLIYKPKIGTGSEGIRVIRKKDGLKALVNSNDYFLQYFIGNGINVVGGFYMIYNGELQSFYSHQRIRTYPPNGGVSVYSKTVANERIKKIGTKLLQKLNWTGWAMIEFMYDDETDEYMVIEINPRAWGSILLSEINHACFIQKYIKLVLGEKTQQMPINYDTYIRWLIPWDILFYIKKCGKIKQFWKLKTKKTVYIGFTYSNAIKSILFILYSALSFKHIKRIII